MRIIDADQITDREIIDYLGIRYASCTPDVRDLLNDQPTIEAVPVVHGHWIEIGVTCGIPILKCSICGKEHLKLHEKFCGNCGADMRKGGVE